MLNCGAQTILMVKRRHRAVSGWSAVAPLSSLPPPLCSGVASPQSQGMAGITRLYAVSFSKPCTSNPPVLPCKHSTFLKNANRSLHFPPAFIHFQNLYPAFSFFAFYAKRKSEHKKFWKRMEGSAFVETTVDKAG
jgi:hypothetical protein